MAEQPDADALARGVLAGERRAIAKAITLVESSRADHEAVAQRMLERLLPSTGSAVRLGISGSPGVGKSTFIESFGLFSIARGKRLAVLAVDPSSSLTGGSILGDKTRMPKLSAAPEAFIRPSPSGKSAGGVARRTREAMLVCEAAGFDVVIVETVGVGQAEYTVSSMVDFFAVLLLGGAGDELQGIKKGILELADGLLVNKCDGDNVARARRAAAEYRSALRLLHTARDGWAPPVETVSGLEGEGMDIVWDMVLRHRAHLEARGALERKRAAQRREWLWSMIREGLERRFLERSDVARVLAEVEHDVDALEITPTRGAARVLDLLGGD